MDLNEVLVEHMTLQYRVIEYAKRPDGSLKADDLRALDKCGMGGWFSTDGMAHQALAEHGVLEKAHARFHKACVDTIRGADAGTLQDTSLSEKGEIKASFVSLCLAITRMSFKIG